MLFWRRSGGFWGEFWEGFGPCEVDFRALKTDQISKPKLEPEKVVPKSRGGLRGVGLAALNW